MVSDNTVEELLNDLYKTRNLEQAINTSIDFIEKLNLSPEEKYDQVRYLSAKCLRLAETRNAPDYILMALVVVD